MWDGDRSITQSQSRLEEILQEKPGKKEWTQWRQLFKSLCHKNFNASSRVSVSRQQRYRHHNDYGHFITQERPAYYTVGMKMSGTIIQSINLMNMNAMEIIFLLLNQEQEMLSSSTYQPMLSKSTLQLLFTDG